MKKIKNCKINFNLQDPHYIGVYGVLKFIPNLYLYGETQKKANLNIAFLGTERYNKILSTKDFLFVIVLLVLYLSLNEDTCFASGKKQAFKRIIRVDIDYPHLDKIGINALFKREIQLMQSRGDSLYTQVSIAQARKKEIDNLCFDLLEQFKQNCAFLNCMDSKSIPIVKKMVKSFNKSFMDNAELIFVFNKPGISGKIAENVEKKINVLEVLPEKSTIFGSFWDKLGVIKTGQTKEGLFLFFGTFFTYIATAFLARDEYERYFGINQNSEKSDNSGTQKKAQINGLDINIKSSPKSINKGPSFKWYEEKRSYSEFFSQLTGWD
jgi:hypothetical protein